MLNGGMVLSAKNPQLVRKKSSYRGLEAIKTPYALLFKASSIHLSCGHDAKQVPWPSNLAANNSVPLGQQNASSE